MQNIIYSMSNASDRVLSARTRIQGLVDQLVGPQPESPAQGRDTGIMPTLPILGEIEREGSRLSAELESLHRQIGRLEEALNINVGDRPTQAKTSDIIRSY